MSNRLDKYDFTGTKKTFEVTLKIGYTGPRSLPGGYFKCTLVAPLCLPTPTPLTHIICVPGQVGQVDLVCVPEVLLHDVAVERLQILQADILILLYRVQLYCLECALANLQLSKIHTNAT